jgi:hypothetical protein
MKGWIRRLWPVLVVAFAGCGGGGSTTVDGYPVVTQNAGFQFPSLATVPDQSAVTGRQSGRVLDVGGEPAAAGWRVELLDVSQPQAPVVVAASTTSTGGTFALDDASTEVAPLSRWIRVTRPDASQIRAFAAGWTEVTPGTELAVTELPRLDVAGAFAHQLTTAELDAAQRSATLWWHGQPGRPASVAALGALLNQLRFHASWNTMLENLAATEPLPGSGDVAGFMPVSSASLEATVTRDGAGSSEPFFVNCFASNGPEVRDCSVFSTRSNDLEQYWTVFHDGIRVLPPRIIDVVTALWNQVGPLPLIEYPHAVGTRVLFDNPRMTVSVGGNTSRGSVRVTRRIYPVASVSALGSTLPAVQVVLDYEIALMIGQRQIDLLTRETSWFSPGKGRVRYDKWTARRDGGVATSVSSMVADSVSDGFVADPRAPMPGRIDIVSAPLRHRDAVASAALGRVYALTPEGTLLELDGATLEVQRSLVLPASPRRVAVSADGSRAYVGLDGASVAEINTADLTIVRRFTVPAGPEGEIHDRVFDLSVDPFDASRVVVLAGDSSVFGGSGTVFIFRAGAWVPANAPTTYGDFGWDAYGLTNVAWSSVRDEFLGLFNGSPMSQYRFRIGTGDVSVLAFSEREEDGSIQDLAGRIVTPLGGVLDAATFTQQRSLSVGSFAVRGCGGLQTGSALCELVPSGDGEELVHLDTSSGAFVGAYRPSVSSVASGCGSGEEAINLFETRRRTFGGGRVLVSGPTADGATRCTLQVWSLHGVTG